MPSKKYIKNKNKEENISLLSKAHSQNYEIKQCQKEDSISNNNNEFDNKNIAEYHEDLKNYPFFSDKKETMIYSKIIYIYKNL